MGVSGEQCAMTSGGAMMLRWLTDNWDSLQMVTKYVYYPAVIRFCKNLILQFRSTGLYQCTLWSWSRARTLGQCGMYWGRIKDVRLLQCWSRYL